MPYSLEDDIRAAGQAGFSAVEIWHSKLVTYLRDHSVADLQRLLRQNQLAVPAICPLFIKYGDDAAPAREALVRAAKVAATLECPTVLVCLGAPPEGLSPVQARALAAAETARAADLVAAHGVRLAIEPLGRHPLVPGPQEALAIIDLAQRNNLGLMLDTFHYYKSAVSLEDIAAVPIDRLLIVHVNDSEDHPRAELRDAHRLYPTLGVIPAEDMLRPLLARGYQGYFSVEIFREEYWNRPVDEITRQAKVYLDRLVARLAAP